MYEKYNITNKSTILFGDFRVEILFKYIKLLVEKFVYWVRPFLIQNQNNYYQKRYCVISIVYLDVELSITVY